MLLYLIIALGGAIGTVTRYALSGYLADQIGGAFPWGTLAVNVTGSFAIGFFDAITSPDGRLLVSSPSRQFFMIGVCGGYTTFSSFSLQTLNLMREGEWLHAGANATGSFVLCLLAVWLGHVAAASLNQMKGP